MVSCPIPHAGIITSGAAILVTALCVLHLAFEANVNMIGELLLAHPASSRTARQTTPRSSYSKKLAIGAVANSGTVEDQDSEVGGGEEKTVDTGTENGVENGARNGDGAVERRRVRDVEGLGLVALEPGQHVGPYRLQEHLGYLGSRPVHALDPAFHPYEVKRVGYDAPWMVSTTTPQSGVCPIRPEAPVCPASTAVRSWLQGGADGEGGDHRGEGLVLKSGSNEDSEGERSYRLKRRFEGGSHGEVWRAVRLGPGGKPSSTQGYVLKRMLLEKGQHVMQAGIREIYFGELLRGRQGAPHVARYVEHFYLFGDHAGGRFGRADGGGDGGVGGGGGEGWDEGSVPTEMWLVFHDEGLSLRQYLYTEREAEGFVLHGQSAFWRDMRLDPKGPEVMKSILRQTLEGTRFLHERGILHRDLKPSNLIVSLPPTPSSKNSDTRNPGGTPFRDSNETLRGDKAPPTQTSNPRDPEHGGGDVHEASPGIETTPSESWANRGWSKNHHLNEDTSTPGPVSTVSHGGRKRRRTGGGGRVGGGGGDKHGESPVLLKVADFSSAVDEGAMAAGLYGAAGPAQQEETLQYAPPEVLFDPETAYSAKRPESYDVWSIGVILLELILGTPEVFTVDQRTRAILERDLAFEDDAVREKAHLLAAMADMCIYSRSGYNKYGEPDIPGSSSSRRTQHSHRSNAHDKRGAFQDDKSEQVHWPLGDRAVVDERCTLAELGKAVHTRDALDIGFPDQWGLDLLRRMLRWDPMERIAVADALEHAYFTGPYRSRRDGSAHATRREAMTHDGWFIGSPRRGPFAVARRLPPPLHNTLWGHAAAGVDADRSSRAQAGLWASDNAGGLVAAPLAATSAGPAGTKAGRSEDSNFMLDNQHSLVELRYSCPKCNRTFELWKSCHNHVTVRDHASFCLYDTSSLPPCVSSHSMLPFDPYSGWCDVQGRRSRIEDYHSIVFQEDYKFYGVFDGHCGTRAAKFASRALHLNLELFLNAVAADPQYPVDPDPPRRTHPSLGTENSHTRFNGVPNHGSTEQQRPSARLQHSEDQSLSDNEEFLKNEDLGENRANIEFAVRSAFRKTQEDFLATSGSRYRAAASRGAGRAPAAASQGVEGLAGGSKDAEAGGGGGAGGADEDSGTTATVALVYAHSTVVAHVGDSRAVMCCDELGGAVDVTEDHTPYSSNERERVEASGGFIEHRGVLRVNGELAVTRTIGNRRLNQHGVLSSEPDVVFISHRQAADARATGGSDGDQSASSRPSFLVLASDGLWDVVSSQEAVDMVKEVILGSTESAHDQAMSAGAGRDGAAELSSIHVAGSEGERGDGREKRKARAEGRRTRVPRGYGVYGPGQAFQMAATALTHEAYVRGSTDNIGVCVVDLRPH